MEKGGNKMKMAGKTKKAVEEYQCPGCVCDKNKHCYRNESDLVCKAHVPGTIIYRVGTILLGMPKGFNRLEETKRMEICIYKTFLGSNWSYDSLNIPIWKYLDKFGNTIVKGICPRINKTWTHIFLEDCIDKIKCTEITEKDLEKME